MRFDSAQAACQPAPRVSAELGSLLLHTLGLAATIEWHLHYLRKGTRIAYELTVEDPVGVELPEALAGALFEVYSQAMSNVVRHAGATQLLVALKVSTHEVTLVVSDNGVGLRKAARGAGLDAMHASARAHSGFCEALGARAGTTVTVSLPFPRRP